MQLVAHLGSVGAAAVLLAMCVVPSVAIAFLVGLRGDGKSRSNDNVLRVAASGTGLLFALIAASTLSTELGSRSDTARAIDREGETVQALKAFALWDKVFTEEDTIQIRDLLDEYVQDVLREEFRFLQGEQAPTAGRDTLFNLFDVVGGVEPDGLPATIRYREIEANLSHLTSARSERLAGAGSSLPTIYWVLIGVTGGAFLLVVALFPWGGSRWMKMVEVLTVSIGVGMAIFAIAVLENPFVGPAALDGGTLKVEEILPTKAAE